MVQQHGGATLDRVASAVGARLGRVLLKVVQARGRGHLPRDINGEIAAVLRPLCGELLRHQQGHSPSPSPSPIMSSVAVHGSSSAAALPVGPGSGVTPASSLPAPALAPAVASLSAARLLAILETVSGCSWIQTLCALPAS